MINLSTTRAAEDVALANGCAVFRSAVGEANVVKKMKECDAIIGGEGSGGVIFPAIHYGRDALIGIAITLQHLLEFGGTMTELKNSLPQYFIAKKKVETGSTNPDDIISQLKERYKNEQSNDEDGLRIDFPDHWVHFRKSNTEPIIRVICEAKSSADASKYIDEYFNIMLALMK